MHTLDLDLNLEHITKVEGAASLDVKVRAGKVLYARFKIVEYKRFFTKAIEGKPLVAVPQLLARICGTCSNAHLLCSIEAAEHALGIEPTEETLLLRRLTMYGLNIRDHALHLYLFVLPDIYGKDSFLAFDEEDEVEHQLLHDGFEVKSIGNFLATLVAGRSVHAIHLNIGGFLHFPDKEGIEEAVKKLEHAREGVLRLIHIFENIPFHFDRKTDFMALIPEYYGFLDGVIKTSKGEVISEKEFGEHLEHTVLPYSQGSAYKYKGGAYMVGALARINLSRDNLHPRTKEAASSALALFPSTDIYLNNLAQAIEILHCIDDAIDILSQHSFPKEEIVRLPYREAVGVGVVEAPRGTLYHKLEVGSDGRVQRAEIVVPTGQNQVNIEEDMKQIVESLISECDKEVIAFELEKLIRAYDPCMSCGAHFLTVNWV